MSGIFITGASSGIGEALARHYAGSGAILGSGRNSGLDIGGNGSGAGQGGTSKKRWVGPCVMNNKQET